jgi:predicted nucleotidyltransferase
MVNKTILKTAEKYISYLPKNLGVKKAYLFGSYAKGHEKEDSDIDIALILEDMPNLFITQQLLMKLRHNFDLRIEPHPFKQEDFNASNPFAFEIERTGIELEF